jgi:2-polyprenyl-3-methyl-5-hydroxy-6-metoxy-1,4-benzoquinol methylase
MLDLPSEAAILDVGSGSGTTLMRLKSLGYRNIIGIDPFIENEIEQPVKVLKTDLQGFNTSGTFDLIMLLHSLEHMVDPIQTLTLARDNLEDNGTIIIRTPVVSYAFQRYGVFWYQLDAPRHIFIFSEPALEMIANKIGLYINRSYYDSTQDVFIWSERYKRDISMNEFRGYIATLETKIFSKDLKKVKILNRDRQGDQTEIGKASILCD